MVQGKIKKFKTNTGEYVYPMTVGKAVYVEPDKNIVDKFNDILAEKGSGLKTYYVDPIRWNLTTIITDYTDLTVATNNTNGINGVLQWAVQNGYLEVILPKGQYLVSDFTAIEPPSYITLNLNGSTLRLRNTGNAGYRMITFDQHQSYCRITNGKLQGDRYDHDYSTPGDHASGYGISFIDCQWIIADSLEICDFTGDNITLTGGPGWVPSGEYDLTTFETGGISLSNGTLTVDTKRQRQVNAIDLNVTKNPYMQAVWDKGYFAIEGDSWGNFGGDINCDSFDVIFYDTNNVFISSLAHVNFFDFIYPPPNARYVKIVMIQSNPISSGGSVMTFGVTQRAQNIYIEKCDIYKGRRCGISCGGRNIYVRDNIIHNIGDVRLSDGTVNGGAAPRAIMDIEDGYGMNQNIWFTGNTCYSATIGVSPVSSRRVHIDNNFFNRVGTTTVWGACLQVSITNNKWENSGVNVYGEATITGNTFYKTNVGLGDSGMWTNEIPVVCSNNIFHNSGLTLSKSTPYRITATGNNFFSDTEGAIDGNAYMSCSGKPQTVADNHFFGAGCTFDDTNIWHVKGFTFKDMFAGNVYIKLPHGIIEDCVFDNAGAIRFPSNSSNFRTVLSNCYFTDTKGNNLLNFNGNKGMRLTIKNSRILWTTSTTLVYSQNDNGDSIIEFSNNYIEYSGLSTNNFSIFNFYTPSFNAGKVIIKGNEIVSNMAISVINTNKMMPRTQWIFQDNTLTTVTQTFTQTDNVTTSGNIVNGVNDPWKNVTDPTTIAWGSYPQGYILNNSNPQPGGNMYWVQTTSPSGYIANASWQASKAYNAKDRILASNGHVYEVASATTSGTVIPNFTGTPGELVNDTSLTTLPKWQPSTAYNVGDTVLQTAAFTYQGSSYTTFFHRKCTTAGTSGATEPAWNGSWAGNTTDNNIVWQNNPLLVWAEVGKVISWKPFGTIGS